MKRLFLAACAVGLIGCANQPAPPPGPAVTGSYPYSRYAYTADVWGHRSPAYKDWSTAQLQQYDFEPNDLLEKDGKVTSKVLTTVKDVQDPGKKIY